MKPSALLAFYRVMAYVTAVLVIVLFVAWGLELGWPEGSSVQQLGETLTGTVGVAHGWLYMIYLVVAFFLTRMLRVEPLKMILVLLAGTVPFGAFFAERNVVRWYNEWIARGETNDPTAQDESRSASS